MGHSRHGGDIGDLQVGVGGRLQIDGAGIGLQRRPHRVQIGSVHEGDLHAVAGHAVVQQGEGAAVQGAVGHDVLAGGGDAPQAGGDSAHTGGRGHTGLAALQRRHLALQHGDGGIAQAGVDVAALLAGKAAAALLTAVKYEGGRLENGCGQRAVLGVLDVACVDRFGTEAEVLIVHIRILLIIAGRRSGSFIVLLHSKSTTNTAETGISKIP